MMSTIDLRGRALSVRDLRGILPRAEFDVEAALETVRPICEVRHRGAEALYELGERFDGVRPAALRVPSDVLAAALSGLDPQVARPSRKPSGGPDSSTRPATGRDHHRGRRRRHRDRALGAGRPRGCTSRAAARSTPRAS